MINLYLILLACPLHLTVCTWCLILSRFDSFLINLWLRERCYDPAERPCTYFLLLPNICCTINSMPRDCTSFFCPTISSKVVEAPLSRLQSISFRLVPFSVFFNTLTLLCTQSKWEYRTYIKQASRSWHWTSECCSIYELLYGAGVESWVDASSFKILKFLRWLTSVLDKASCEVWLLLREKFENISSNDAITSVFDAVEDGAAREARTKQKRQMLRPALELHRLSDTSRSVSDTFINIYSYQNCSLPYINAGIYIRMSALKL